MQYWICSVSQTNWKFLKDNKIWAVPTIDKGKKIKKDDKIIFYINGTLHFHGIYEVQNDWHPPTKTWPDQNFANKMVFEIDLNLIQLGYANIRKLAASLKFIEKKESIGVYLRGTKMGPANSGKPISEDDYKQILDELKNEQIEPNFKKIKDETNEIEELVELSEKSFKVEKIPPPDKKTLEQICNDVEKGKCGIPNFQRYWTWNRKQIEELWESIFQGYYIGSLLVWETNDEKELDATPIKGGPALTNAQYLVLDGQQRITAIYYVVRSPDTPLPNIDSSYEFFLNINAILDPNRDSSEIINSYTQSQIQKMRLCDKNTQYRQKLFPLTLMYNKTYTNWLLGFYNYLKNDEDYSDIESENYHKKLNEILDNVWATYEIPTIKLPADLTLDNVATVFERINSKGTALGIFDLLNARFNMNDIVLKDLWNDSKKKHKALQLWHDVYNNEKTPLYVLQAISLFKSGNLKRKQLLNIDSLYRISGKFQKNQFEEDWENMSKHVEKAIISITSTDDRGFGAFKYDFVPYTVMVPLLASLFTEIDGRKNKTECHKKIRIWYWSSILNDRYSRSTESIAQHDFKMLQNWFDQTIKNPFSIDTQITLNTKKRTSALFKSILCIIMKNRPLDFIQNDPPQFGSLELHHIFPKSKANEFNAGTDIDSVLNQTLIFDSTNNSIADKNPSEYIKEIIDNEKNIDESELEKRFATHLISKKAFLCLLDDDFAGFIKAREETIRQEFNKLCSENETPTIDEFLTDEDQHVEYKETLRWNIRTNQIDQDLEETVMKELACFMNSEGGKIFIGVSDEKIPIGLERDYQTLKRHNSGDFLEHLTNLINKYFDKNVNNYIKWVFHNRDNKEICVGDVSPASEPIFINTKNEKKFYVRMNNTCQPLDVADSFKYIPKHWPDLK